MPARSLLHHEAQSPLLGSEAASNLPHYPTLPRPSRRQLARGVVSLVPLVVVALVVLASPWHSAVPALAPVHDKLYDYLDKVRFGTDYERELEARPGGEFDPGVAQDPVEWGRDDQALRKYDWTTPTPHSSLVNVLRHLTPAQNGTREWLLETRPRSQGGSGIGLGMSDPPEPIRPRPRAATHDALPTAMQGPGLFVSGSFDKYEDLVREWKTGRPVGACEKGNWEDEYTKLHADMMRGARPASLLEFACHAGELCGGIADRFLGMVTTFLYSILTKRAFSVSWEQPAPFDMLFDSPYIDWSRPFSNESTTGPRGIYRNASLVESMHEVNGHNWEEAKIDEFFPDFVDRYSNGGTTPWLKFQFNRGVVIRSFSYESIAPLIEATGLRLSTAYSCLLNYLIRPKRAVLDFVAQYTSLFSLPEYFVIGLQVRTGDTSMYASRKDAINTVDRHARYFRCAEAVSRKYAHPSQKVLWYLISDSKVLERSALERYPDKVVVTGLKQSHVEIKTGSTAWTGVKGASDGFLRTVAESYIFAGTDFQILTLRSGFGKIPTWLRGREGSTIQVFNPHMDAEYTRLVKKKHKGKLPPELDCSLDSSLRSFSEMAQDWQVVHFDLSPFLVKR
ncbi:hypothetical protein JCM10212_004983 [Sporobolomyces blumeae]